MKQRGLSGVIASVIMIAVVITSVVIVWGVVIPLVEDNLGESESCFGIFEEVTINSMYTCYDSDLGEFNFSINIADIDVDEVLVSVSSEGSTKSYTLTNTEKIIVGLANYGSTGFGTDLIKLPEKNAGSTYISNEFPDEPNRIQIAPIIDGNQCDVSDSLFEIDDC